MKRCKFLWILTICALLLLSVTGWIIWSNFSIQVTHYTIANSQLPEGFSGFRIAQISDLHNAAFGKDNSRLLKKLTAQQPDIIVITGDIVDSQNWDNSIAFAGRSAAIAPTYYIPGNHEDWIDDYDQLESLLKQCGVTVLRNQTVFLDHNGSTVALSGVDDAEFFIPAWVNGKKTEIKDALQAVSSQTDGYHILLTHRPDLFETYQAYGFDLIFTGHAHGGQIRIPFVGGVYAPNQGLFPEYDSGIYRKNSSTMVVSRGLGNGTPLPRINNRPEIVIAELIP